MRRPSPAILPAPLRYAPAGVHDCSPRARTLTGGLVGRVTERAGALPDGINAEPVGDNVGGHLADQASPGIGAGCLHTGCEDQLGEGRPAVRLRAR